MDFETEELGFDLREQHGSRAHLAFSAFSAFSAVVRVHS